MRIAVVAVGRLKERFWKEAADEYLTRLRPYAAVEVVEVNDRDPGKGGDERALADEGADVVRAIPKDSYVVALCIGGNPVSSEQLAEKLSRLAVDGRSDVTFLIGGSLGLSREAEAVAHEKISFGPITLPHNLARVVLLEQLYRAFKIIKREPYHK